MSTESVESGPRERHLLRRRANPLFAEDRRAVSTAELAHAREQDAAQLQAFLDRLQDLIQRAIDLKPNESSDKVLELKAELDRAYVEIASLPGDHANIREALARLVEVTMQAVRRAAGPDPTAREELDQEEMARRTNYELLRQPLVADLMLPQSPIPEDELVPTLLAESEEAVSAALWLFEPDHVAQLAREGRELLSRLEEQGLRPAGAWERLAQLEQGGSGLN